MSNFQPKNAYLQFDFPLETNQMGIAFEQPTEIIVAYQLHEVRECLEKIDHASKKGKYLAGYMGFEASYAFFDMQEATEIQGNKPLLWFGVFEEPIPLKTQTKTTYSISNWKCHTDKTTYLQDIDDILAEIEKKTFSQINYTTKWETSFQGDPLSYYNDLKKAQKANYCAYLQMDDHHILSISPELFFQTTNNKITVRPMKGTINRGNTLEEDIVQRDWLKNSSKNKYENKLTTDLMLEELQPLTHKNTAEITKQYTIETYPTVYQMTSEITGSLQANTTCTTILKQLFPCTSIAGTPKQDALKWIHHVEKLPRDIYCGTVGYIKPNGDATFNVAIRTIDYDAGNSIMSYGAGGAITKHSNADEEYREMLAKTAFLHRLWEPFSLLETIGLQDGQLFLLEEHLDRLSTSATYFSIPCDLSACKKALKAYEHSHPQGDWRIRFTLDEDGLMQTTIQQNTKTADMPQAIFSSQPIDKNNLFHYHKTTNRSIYDSFLKQAENYFDVLLWNEDGEITEFTIGNIVIEYNGQLLTPSITSGLLAGTFRKHLLEEGKIKEAIIQKEDVLRAENIWLINSVRKWLPIQVIQ